MGTQTELYDYHTNIAGMGNHSSIVD